MQQRKLKLFVSWWWEAAGGHWLDFQEINVLEHFVCSAPPTPEHAMPIMGEVTLAALEQAGSIEPQPANEAKANLVPVSTSLKGLLLICAPYYSHMPYNVLYII